MTRIAHCLVGLAAMLLSTMAVADAASYTFTNIAHSSSFFLIRGASMNEGGRVAFDAWRTREERGIFATSGGPIDTIALTASPGGAFSTPAINASGTVAIIESFNPPRPGHPFSDASLRTVNGAHSVTIAETGAFFGGFQEHISIMPNGTVVFNASLGDRTGMFSGNAGSVTPIVDTSGPLSTLFGPRSTLMGRLPSPRG